MEIDGVTIDVPAAPEAATNLETEATESQAPPEKDWAKEAQKLQEILNRKDRQLSKTRAELAEAARVKALYEAEKNAPKPPKSEDFTDITDEVAAKMDYLAQKKAYDEKLKQLQAQPEAQPQGKEYAPEFVELVKAKFPLIEKAVAENPEFRQLYESNMALLDAAPVHVEEIVFDLADPVAAIQELLKSGDLESLYHMPPHKAALRIAQAEAKGKAMQRPITKATPPISTNKGTAPVSSIENLRGAKAIDWLNS